MEINLNHTDLKVLYSLSNRCDHCAIVLQQDLADHLYYSRQNINRALQRLEQLGLISRRRLPDRRGRPYIYEVLHAVSNPPPGLVD